MTTIIEQLFSPEGEDQKGKRSSISRAAHQKRSLHIGGIQGNHLQASNLQAQSPYPWQFKLGLNTVYFLELG